MATPPGSWLPIRRALMVLSIVLAAACGGGGEQQAASSKQELRVTRLVMGVVAPGQETNSMRLLGQGDTWPIRPMYEHLIGLDPASGKLVPQLATEWNIEPDGRSFRFKLRKGVPFHGGWGEFTARDVVFSSQDTTRDDALGSEAVLLRRVVDGVDVVNDYEVVFRLNAPDVDFLQVVSQVQGGLRIMSKAHFDAAGDPTLQTAPVAGTGPYQFKERAQGVSVRYERVPYQHWRVMPDFAEFEFRFQNETSSRLAALLAGEIQITSLPPDLVPQAEAQGFKIARGRVAALRTWLAGYCCFVNAETGAYPANPSSPLLDPRVRRALNKAINRDELNRAFFAGKGETMYRNPFHPTREGWNPEWATRFPDEYGYDATRARALLAEAGKSDLSTNVFVIRLPHYPGSEDVTEAIAGYWRAIGVTVQMSEIEGGQLTAGLRALRFDNHFGIRASSGELFVGLSAHNSSVLGNYLGEQHPDVNALVKRIQVELDDKKRDDLYRQAGNLAYDLHLGMPLFWLPAEAVINPRIVGDYIWPGSISGTWTHVEYIKAAR